MTDGLFIIAMYITAGCTDPLFKAVKMTNNTLCRFTFRLTQLNSPNLYCGLGCYGAA